MEITVLLVVEYIILVFAGIFPIANPFSTAPIFLALTKGFDTAQQNQIAFKASVYMAGVLLAFLFAGAMILGFFGITIPGLRIAGGLIIIFMGMRMLFPAEHIASEAKTPKPQENIAFTPLAMPMLSGPGSISVVLAMSDKVANLKLLSEMVIGYLVVAIGIILTVTASWLVLRSSSKIMGLLGESGIDVLTRFMAFFLVAIGVEFFLGGLTGYLELIGVVEQTSS